MEGAWLREVGGAKGIGANKGVGLREVGGAKAGL